MIKDNRNEIIESLRKQNSFWAEEYCRVDSDNLELKIYLIIAVVGNLIGWGLLLIL